VWTALWAVYIIWGSTYLFIAIAVETIPPLLAVSTRFIAAGAIMAAIVVARGGTLRVTRAGLLSCVVVGCLLPGANAVLFFAEEDVPTGLASLIIASVPLWVVLIRVGLRERQQTAVLVGVGTGFAGVAILLQPEGSATTLGIGLCVVSSVMWAAGSVAAARLPMPADPFAATTWAMFVGGLLMLPLGLTKAGSLSVS
jgi:drug/metabolite transporter (DMT)-like permease